MKAAAVAGSAGGSPVVEGQGALAAGGDGAVGVLDGPGPGPGLLDELGGGADQDVVESDGMRMAG